MPAAPPPPSPVWGLQSPGRCCTGDWPPGKGSEPSSPEPLGSTERQ